MISPTLTDLIVPIDTIRPYARNPRRGDLGAIRRSLEVNGQYRPIVVNRRTGEALAGNHTLRAALDLGWTEIAATFVDADDEQAARIVLVDNRTNDLAYYDNAELVELLSQFHELDGTGWQERERDRLIDELDENLDRDTEPIEPPVEPTSRPGDIWQLGQHRLICGDSTVPDDVDRLLAGADVEMVWTDPPYGLDYHAPRGTRKGYRNRADGASFANDFTDHDRLYELVHGALALARDHTRAGGAIYVAHADSAFTHGGSVFRKALLDAGWELHQVLIWVKNAFVLSRQDYHWQHEPILYGWKPGAGHRWNGTLGESSVFDDDVDPTKLDKRQLVQLVRQLQNERGTTVTRENRPRENDLHPTMKPVGLVARHVRNSSRRGELVYEPFGGSGTTMIASENIGRRCALVEYLPGYCDVIVDRWERHTGGTAERIEEGAAVAV